MRNRRTPRNLRRAKAGDSISVYVASLEAYNAGRLVGKWLELPVNHPLPRGRVSTAKIG